MKPFDPFASSFIRPSWHKKIKLYVAPKITHIYGRSLEGTGKCCEWRGWNNAKHDGPHGIVRVGGVRWYLHRYAYCQYHNVDLGPTEIIDHICRRRLCFNPLHLECVTHKENTDRGNGVHNQFKPAHELSEEDIEGFLG